MSNRAKWNRPKHPPITSRGRILMITPLLFVVAFIAFLAVRRLRAPINGSGPKIILADGATYYACGGALWTSSGDFKPNTNPLYEVLYVDVNGRQQQIHHVQTLIVRNLAPNSPSCRPGPSVH